MTGSGNETRKKSNVKIILHRVNVFRKHVSQVASYIFLRAHKRGVGFDLYVGEFIYKKGVNG